MSDETQIQSSEKKVYEVMPPVEEFDGLDSATQKELLNKFSSQDQEEEKSETSSTEKETSEEVQPDQTDEKPESKVEDKQTEKPVVEEPAQVKKYKELEAEFTRRSQRMRELERTVEELKSKVNKGQEPEVKSPLAKLVETNPNAKELVEAIEAEVKFRLDKGLENGIRPIQEKLTQQTSDENFNKFQSEVKEFLGSPLGKLEAEFNQIAAELYENQDALLEAASKDPALFKNLKKEVLSRHFVKAARFMGETVTQEDKNKRVKDTGISGKAKTSTTVDDDLDLKVFRGKSSAEMREILDKHGAVKRE
jgi:hypothetical protein